MFKDIKKEVYYEYKYNSKSKRTTYNDDKRQ